MAVNDKIVIADYNSIRSKVVSILGTGSADSGYGQALRSSEVSISSRVTVNEWSDLYYDIVNCYVHQTGAVPPSASVATEGATVRYDATTSPITQYDTFANSIVSNKFSVDSSQLYTTNQGTATQVWPGVYGDYWNATIACTVTVTFTSADAARYFFNSGGELRFTSSLTGSTANDQTTNWTSFLTSVGTKTFSATKPNTGTDPNDNTNFYRLTNSYSVWTTDSSSSPYTSNVYRIQARSNVADNSTGTATQIEFLVQWIDGYVASGPAVPENPPPGDEVYGRINLNVTTATATGVLVPSGAGNFTVESPTVVIGPVAPSTALTIPTYSIAPRASSVNEGSSIIFDILNDQFSSGTLYLKFIGTYNTGATATVAVSAFAATYTVSPTADLTTEGAQSFQLEMRTGSQTGTLVATSSAVTVNDTSTNPIPSISVLVVGGGGGGGGQFFDGSVGSGGGGGGSGGYRSSSISTSPGQVLNIAIGTGGNGSGYNSNAVGGTGGTSYIGTVTATGGTGGFSNFANPYAGTGGSPNGVNGNPGGFGSFSGGLGGNNGTGFGSGGNGGSNSAGVPGSSGGIRISYPGTYTISPSASLAYTSTYDGVNTTYTFTSGTGLITI